MKEYGFIRVGAIVNKLYLADPIENSKELIKMIKEAESKGIIIVVTPELSLTGYTCQDLFLQDKLLTSAITSLNKILTETKNLDIISIIGFPLKHDNQLFNTSVVIQKGKILGIIPKTYIPNYGEFYEKRWFASSTNLVNNEVILLNQKCKIGTDLIFEDKTNKDISFAIEICEDLWSVNPPSTSACINGATIIFNQSSSNEIIGKKEYRRNLVSMQSAKTISAYVYTSSGIMESTSDLLFGGDAMIYENGTLLKQNERFDLESNLIYADIDIMKLQNDRRRNISFMSILDEHTYRRVEVDIKNNNLNLERNYNEYPFVPSNLETRNERCEEILNIQSSSLARRLLLVNNAKCVIGISGGLDSTLAFLVAYKALKKLKRSPKDIIAVTMPGFGTTNRTYKNAISLVKEYGATLKEINIKDACKLHMKDIGLSENDRSITFENIQARERMQILMDIANMENGIVIGTGDLSELALGWCTYNADHMSMYSVNSSIPKTLVRYLIKYISDNEVGKKKEVIEDILSTPISPELLPPNECGEIIQKTESAIGPYVLHDFFLYYFLRCGFSPKKIFLLAENTFKNNFSKEEILKWLKVFIKRFFTQQFKRNCMPDGVKVGSVSLSPRGDFRMPSDAEYSIWMKEILEIEKEVN